MCNVQCYCVHTTGSIQVDITAQLGGGLLEQNLSISEVFHAAEEV